MLRSPGWKKLLGLAVPDAYLLFRLKSMSTAKRSVSRRFRCTALAMSSAILFCQNLDVTCLPAHGDRDTRRYPLEQPIHAAGSAEIERGGCNQRRD